MAIRLSDAEISRLLAERKPLPPDYRERILTKHKRGHKERELDVIGTDGSEFRLIFSAERIQSARLFVIIAYRPPKTNQLFRLRRYNGKSHEHTNTLDGQTFYDFHLHKATERSGRIRFARRFLCRADKKLCRFSWRHPRNAGRLRIRCASRHSRHSL
jgi:hypothetical protein